MKLRFCESEITYWEERYVEHANEESLKNEQEFMDLKHEIQKRGHLTKDELYQVAYWKSPRRSKLVLENSDEAIEKVTADVFVSENDNDKLLELTKLKGIGEPIASAILHFYYKGKYPILDIHALWSSGLEWMNRNSYPFWVEYIQFCRGLAERNGVDMRTVDRALWLFSVDHPDKESIEDIDTSSEPKEEIDTFKENIWKVRRRKLEDLKNGQRYSPELKTYILCITDKLCSLGMSIEECANILGMWSGTLISWKDDGED